MSRPPNRRSSCFSLARADREADHNELLSGCPSNASSASDAQRNAAEIVTRVQVEIAKLERAKAPGRTGRPPKSPSTPEGLSPLPEGRRAVEDKALAEAPEDNDLGTQEKTEQTMSTSPSPSRADREQTKCRRFPATPGWDRIPDRFWVAPCGPGVSARKTALPKLWGWSPSLGHAAKSAAALGLPALDGHRPRSNFGVGAGAFRVLAGDDHRAI